MRGGEDWGRGQREKEKKGCGWGRRGSATDRQRSCKVPGVCYFNPNPLERKRAVSEGRCCPSGGCPQGSSHQNSRQNLGAVERLRRVNSLSLSPAGCFAELRRSPGRRGAEQIRVLSRNRGCYFSTLETVRLMRRLSWGRTEWGTKWECVQLVLEGNKND